ncbi:hypothetical protein QBC34DRAFT_175509 [Podospora aff. communis PSN243]|uniref:Stress response protein NST1 n=1 Tax=Podospora aff. communis PSN243 TaxID=3040156 RepID=A0AAV9H1Y3_9PEZI|nr:hypothetical protein QBC34DRAFT_175509 [Podospora aff. communis PSN243]
MSKSSQAMDSTGNGGDGGGRGGRDEKERYGGEASGSGNGGGGGSGGRDNGDKKDDDKKDDDQKDNDQKEDDQKEDDQKEDDQKVDDQKEDDQKVDDKKDDDKEDNEEDGKGDNNDSKEDKKDNESENIKAEGDEEDEEGKHQEEEAKAGVQHGTESGKSSVKGKEKMKDDGEEDEDHKKLLEEEQKKLLEGEQKKLLEEVARRKRLEEERKKLEKNSAAWEKALKFAWGCEEERERQKQMPSARSSEARDSGARSSGVGGTAPDKSKGTAVASSSSESTIFPGLMDDLLSIKRFTEQGLGPPRSKLLGMIKSLPKYQNQGNTKATAPSLLQQPAPSLPLQPVGTNSHKPDEVVKGPVREGILHGGPPINHTEEIIERMLAHLDIDALGSYEPPPRGSQSQKRGSGSQIQTQGPRSGPNLSYRNPALERPSPSVEGSGYFGQTTNTPSRPPGIPPKPHPAFQASLNTPLGVSNAGVPTTPSFSQPFQQQHLSQQQQLQLVQMMLEEQQAKQKQAKKKKKAEQKQLIQQQLMQQQEQQQQALVSPSQRTAKSSLQYTRSPALGDGGYYSQEDPSPNPQGRRDSGFQDFYTPVGGSQTQSPVTGAPDPSRQVSGAHYNTPWSAVAQSDQTQFGPLVRHAQPPRSQQTQAPGQSQQAPRSQAR